MTLNNMSTLLNFIISAYLTSFIIIDAFDRCSVAEVPDKLFSLQVKTNSHHFTISLIPDILNEFE